MCTSSSSFFDGPPAHSKTLQFILQLQSDIQFECKFAKGRFETDDVFAGEGIPFDLSYYAIQDHYHWAMPMHVVLIEIMKLIFFCTE